MMAEEAKAKVVREQVKQERRSHTLQYISIGVLAIVLIFGLLTYINERSGNDTITKVAEVGDTANCKSNANAALQTASANFAVQNGALTQNVALGVFANAVDDKDTVAKVQASFPSVLQAQQQASASLTIAATDYTNLVALATSDPATFATECHAKFGG